MIQSCSECGRRYDDFDHWTFCPHEKFAASPTVLERDVTRRAALPTRIRRQTEEPYVLESDLGFEHLPPPPPNRLYGYLVRVSTTDLHGNRDATPIFTQINGVGGEIPRERQVALLPQFVNVLRDSHQNIKHYGEVLMDYEGNVHDFLHSVRWESTGLEFEAAAVWLAYLRQALAVPRVKR